MSKGIFSPDSSLMILLGYVTDVIFLSLFFIAGCVPVVTVGASFAALYDASYRCFQQGYRNCWVRFWGSFRLNWKSGILPTLVFLGACYALGSFMISFWNAAVAGTMSWALFAALAVVAVLVLGALSVLFPVLSRFENSTVGLLKNTLMLAFVNLPRTAALGVLNALCIYACFRLLIPVFFLPSLAAAAGGFLLEPMFRPYMNEDDAEP